MSHKKIAKPKEPTLVERLARIIVGSFKAKLPPAIILTLLSVGFEKKTLEKANDMAMKQVDEALKKSETAVVMPPEKKVIM